MKQKTVYITNSGINFKNKAKCLTYEKMVKNNKFGFFKIGYQSGEEYEEHEAEWEIFITVYNKEEALQIMEKLFKKAKNGGVLYELHESDIKSIKDFLLKTLEGDRITWDEIIYKDELEKMYNKFIKSLIYKENKIKAKRKKETEKKEKELYNRLKEKYDGTHQDQK